MSSGAPPAPPITPNWGHERHLMTSSLRNKQGFLTVEALKTGRIEQSAWLDPNLTERRVELSIRGTSYSVSVWSATADDELHATRTEFETAELARKFFKKVTKR